MCKRTVATQLEFCFSFCSTDSAIIQKFDTLFSSHQLSKGTKAFLTQPHSYYEYTVSHTEPSLTAQGLFSSSAITLFCSMQWQVCCFNQSNPNTQRKMKDRQKSRCTHSVRSSVQSSMLLGLEDGARKRVRFSSTGMSRLSTQHSSPTWACESECTHHRY